MIRFEKETHTYRLDGTIVPSVSEIVRRITKKSFDHIPIHILKTKQHHGTKVHEAIEGALFHGKKPSGSILVTESATEAIRLLEPYTPILGEEIVNFGYLYAGTFDLLARGEDGLALFDYKTSAELDEDALRLQLNAYRIAYEFETGSRINNLYAIWLPKNSYGRKIEIDKMNDEELLDLFERNRP